MRKRLMAILLCLGLVCCLLPLTGFAASESLIEAAKNSYLKAQEDAQQESFNGFCGKLTSYQLWNMGINSGLLPADGNKQFELYSAMKRTSGGYYVCSYSAEEYTLERALNTITRNGTQNAYNLLVCFEWTSTEEGNVYGHAVVINGIVDGQVYFVESFYTQLGGEEGNVVVCSIPEFAGIFEGWTLFEGVVHFGGKNYADACKSYATDLFVSARFTMDLRSQPCMMGTDSCKTVRTVSAGERLRVTSLVKNTYDEWYYLVEDGDQVGYLVADTVVPVRFNTEDITVSDFAIKPPQKEETDLQLSGKIRAKNGMVGTVELLIFDDLGNEVFSNRQIIDDYRVDLEDLNEALDFSSLKDGAYTVELWAETATAYISQGKLAYSQTPFLLERQELVVGDVDIPVIPRMMEEPEVRDGWYWMDGLWYYFEGDLPKSGWLKEKGVWYYLQEDGVATTGKAEIGEKTYYFTETGAMCVGWYKTNQGMRYLLSDGTVATGWQTIGGSRYWFDDGGNMQKTGTRTENDITYRFQADGKAVEVRDPRMKE